MKRTLWYCWDMINIACKFDTRKVQMYATYASVGNKLYMILYRFQANNNSKGWQGLEVVVSLASSLLRPRTQWFYKSSFELRLYPFGCGRDQNTMVWWQPVLSYDYAHPFLFVIQYTMVTALDLHTYSVGTGLTQNKQSGQNAFGFSIHPFLVRIHLIRSF